MRQVISQPTMTNHGIILDSLLVIGGTASGLVLLFGRWHSVASAPSSMTGVLNIGVLVFREGLECVLVLAAIAAGVSQTRRSYQRAIAIGAGAGFAATLLTWDIAVRVLSDLSENISALALQAATGLLAVIVLLIVMNWFFHKVYWTGWISAHSQRKRRLIEEAKAEQISVIGLFWGMGALGFTSVYREGFEVVLFLQSYRLRLGGPTVLRGVCVGLFLSGVVAILTFLAHRKLPYRRMLVLTGILLGLVLMVMVGEQAQEMQLAHWIPTTNIPWLVPLLPDWLGVWFSVFPTVETVLAQAAAGSLVIGSYVIANREAAVAQSSAQREPVQCRED